MPVAERLGRNESLFRAVNEQIRRREEAVRVPARYVGFVCECLATGCMTRVDATLEEYGRVRARPTRFLTAIGHIDPAREDVMLATDRFAVVERRVAA